MQDDRVLAEAMPWANLRLPPFPQVAVRILQLARNENVQLHQLCDLVSSDPAFASELLTVANSVLYAPRYPSASIVQAVAVLGANTLQGMCVAVGVRAYLGKTMCYPAMRALWRHSLASALVAQRLARVCLIDKDTAFTAGILHDVGRMGLAVIQPAPYAALLDRHRGAAPTLLDAERALFGWDHCQTGRRLVEGWNLPEEIQSAVFQHHQPPSPDGVCNLLELVKVSCELASALGFAAFSGCETPPPDGLLARLPSSAHSLVPNGLAAFAKDLADSIHAIEAI